MQRPNACGTVAGMSSAALLLAALLFNFAHSSDTSTVRTEAAKNERSSVFALRSTSRPLQLPPLRRRGADRPSVPSLSAPVP